MNASFDVTAILIVAGIACVVFLAVLGAMAVGVMFGRRPISGSCGGLGNRPGADGKTSCSLCENPADACRELRQRMEGTADAGAGQPQTHAAKGAEPAESATTR